MDEKKERIKKLITKTVQDITELTIELVYNDEDNETIKDSNDGEDKSSSTESN